MIVDETGELEQMRALLRSRFEQSSLRDEKRFAANFEELLRVAWQEHLERSKHLSVKSSPPSVVDR